MKDNPKTFISYAWESDEIKKWVKNLAIRLRGDSVDLKLDQWEVIPGDKLTHFMEKSVRENNYVLIICTPDYKKKSENRIGGVGYEGDIMTAEVLNNSNHRKFIPILKSGNKNTAIPSWIKGKYYIDLTSDELFEKNYDDLITTLLNIRETAPELGEIPSKYIPIDKNEKKKIDKKTQPSKEEVIRIKGIIINEVTEPKNDDSRGSALYKVPFELNQKPSSEWIDFFIQAWNNPPEFTSMHRPGIASIYGDKIFLDGTTIKEVEKYHKNTLKLAVEEANKKYNKLIKSSLEEDFISIQQELKNKKEIKEFLTAIDGKAMKIANEEYESLKK